MNNIPKIMSILKSHYPSHTKTTLNRMRDNPEAFKILISCLLSLRTKDKNTEKVSKNLFEIASNPEQILKLPMKKLEKLIFSSGHYKKKARVLKHVSKIILKDYNGKVPNTKEELMSIKGIGPKTANIVLAFAFGKLVLPIDTHCHKIPNRLGWIKTKTPEKTEEELARQIGCSRSTVTRSLRESGQETTDVASLTQQTTDEVQNEDEKQGSESENEGGENKEKPIGLTDKVGKPVPSHLVDVFSRAGEIRIHMNHLDEMRRKAEEKCGTDPLWFFVRLNPLQKEIANVKRIYNFSLPFAVCPMHGNERLEDAKDCRTCRGAGWLTEPLYAAVPSEFK